MSSKPTLDNSSVQDDEGASSTKPQPQPSSLSIFHEDIILAVLSYVADAPFETADNERSIDGHSTLTDTLPLVSKQFRKLTRHHDAYWKNALLRQVKKEPNLWGQEGMARVIFNATLNELRAEIAERARSKTTRRRDKRTKYGEQNQQRQFASKIYEGRSYGVVPTSEITGEEKLEQLACKAARLHPPRRLAPSGEFENLYKSIFLGHVRYRAPVFCMPSRVRLGSTYGLHFFEPRYRLLISETMSGYPPSARRGEPILPYVPGLYSDGRVEEHVTDDDVKASIEKIMNMNDKNEGMLDEHHLPTFIHAHQGPLRPNTPATIVRVEQCVIYPNGSADVFLRPLSYMILEEIWQRPGTGGLVEAKGMRMGKEAGESYERWCGMRGFGRGDGRGRGQMLPIP